MNCTKHIPLVVACLALSAATVGCKPTSDSESSTTDNRNATARRSEGVEQKAAEAAQEMKDYTYAQRTEFVATMQGQLDELQRDLDRLAAQVERASTAAKTEANPRLQALRDKAAELRTHLDAAKNATESTWDDVKAGFKQGYSELKDGFNQARQWVSDKIAP